MKRDKTIEIRVSAEEKAAIEVAAKADSRSVSDWLRLAALAKATKAPEEAK